MIPGQSYIQTSGVARPFPGSYFRSDAIRITPNQVQSGAALNPVNIYGFFCYNPNAVDCFVKFYVQTASPTVGTDFPALTIHVPSLSSVALNGNEVLLNTTTKLWVACTTGYLDTDTGNPVTGLLIQLNISYQ